MIYGFARASLATSMRVLVRPIGLDMEEVGGSNPTGPTKNNKPGTKPGSFFNGCAQACRVRLFTLNGDMSNELKN